MPLYEWQCEACGKDFESLSKPFDKVSCPNCLTFEVNKKISAKQLHRVKGDNSASTTPAKDRIRK